MHRVVLASFIGFTVFVVGCAGCGPYGDHVAVAEGDLLADHWEGQQDPRWCWAACLRMRGSITGDDVPGQDELIELYKRRMSGYFPGIQGGEVVVTHVRTAFDKAVDAVAGDIEFDEAAASWEMEEAMSPGHLSWMQDRGALVIDADDVVGPTMSECEILGALDEGEPVLVSLTEASEFARHAYVIVAADVEDNSPTHFYMLDPMDEEMLAKIDIESYRDRVRMSISKDSVLEAQENEKMWVQSQELRNGIFVRNPAESESGAFGRFFLGIFRPGTMKPLYEVRIRDGEFEAGGNV